MGTSTRSLSHGSLLITLFALMGAAFAEAQLIEPDIDFAAEGTKVTKRMDLTSDGGPGCQALQFTANTKYVVWKVTPSFVEEENNLGVPVSRPTRHVSSAPQCQCQMRLASRRTSHTRSFDTVFSRCCCTMCMRMRMPMHARTNAVTRQLALPPRWLIGAMVPLYGYFFGSFGNNAGSRSSFDG